MNITGKVSKKNGRWFIQDLEGKEYELRGYDMKPRMDGLTIRVVGNLEDSFGADFFDVPKVLIVQRLNVV